MRAIPNLAYLQDLEAQQCLRVWYALLCRRVREEADVTGAEPELDEVLAQVQAVAHRVKQHLVHAVRKGAVVSCGHR